MARAGMRIRHASLDFHDGQQHMPGYHPLDMLFALRLLGKRLMMATSLLGLILLQVAQHQSSTAVYVPLILLDQAKV